MADIGGLSEAVATLELAVLRALQSASERP
jgi:hypothetical protein